MNNYFLLPLIAKKCWGKNHLCFPDIFIHIDCNPECSYLAAGQKKYWGAEWKKKLAPKMRCATQASSDQTIQTNIGSEQLIQTKITSDLTQMSRALGVSDRLQSRTRVPNPPRLRTGGARPTSVAHWRNPD